MGWWWVVVGGMPAKGGKWRRWRINCGRKEKASKAWKRRKREKRRRGLFGRQAAPIVARLRTKEANGIAASSANPHANDAKKVTNMQISTFPCDSMQISAKNAEFSLF